MFGLSAISKTRRGSVDRDGDGVIVMNHRDIRITRLPCKVPDPIPKGPKSQGVDPNIVEGIAVDDTINFARGVPPASARISRAVQPD